MKLRLAEFQDEFGEDELSPRTSLKQVECFCDICGKDLDFKHLKPINLKLRHMKPRPRFFLICGECVFKRELIMQLVGDGVPYDMRPYAEEQYVCRIMHPGEEGDE